VDRARLLLVLLLCCGDGGIGLDTTSVGAGGGGAIAAPGVVGACRSVLLLGCGVNVVQLWAEVHQCRGGGEMEIFCSGG